MQKSFLRVSIAIVFSFILNLAIFNAQAVVPSSYNSQLIFFGLVFTVLVYGLLCLNSILRISKIRDFDYNQYYLNTNLEMSKYLDGNEPESHDRDFESELEKVEFNYWVNNNQAPNQDIHLNH